MANIEMTKAHIFKWEGSFAWDPDDAGGATMKGVTLSTFRKYYGQERTVEDLKHITDDQWEYIFRKGYWNKAKCDQIEDDRTALLICDMCFMSGTITALKNVQKCLGCEPDGIIGNKTLAAINSNPQKTFDMLFRMREEWLYRIAQKGNNKIFLKGWLNRLYDINK